MELKHTPGPWIGIDPSTGKYRETEWTADNDDLPATGVAPIMAQSDTVALVVADCYDPKLGVETIRANARLIAAAPDLLSATIQVEAILAQIIDQPSDTLNKLRAAIAKATGANHDH